jgi:hypothetical protein
MGFEDQERKTKNSYQTVVIKTEFDDLNYVELIRVQNVWNPRDRGYDEYTFMVEIHLNLFPSATNVSVWNYGWEHVFTMHDVPTVSLGGDAKGVFKTIRDELLRVACEVCFGQEVKIDE